AFVAAIGPALSVGGPTASAALAAKSASIASLIGALAGAAGVLIGMKHLEPYFDDQEERELKRFRNASLLTVIGASLVLPFTLRTAPPRWLAGFTALAFFGVLGYLHTTWLPRILDRRWRWEC